MMSEDRWVDRLDTFLSHCARYGSEVQDLDVTSADRDESEGRLDAWVRVYADALECAPPVAVIRHAANAREIYG